MFSELSIANQMKKTGFVDNNQGFSLIVNPYVVSPLFFCQEAPILHHEYFEAALSFRNEDRTDFHRLVGKNDLTGALSRKEETKRIPLVSPGARSIKLTVDVIPRIRVFNHGLRARSLAIPNTSAQVARKEFRR